MHGKIKTRRWLRFLGAAGMAMPALLSGEPAGAVPAGVDHGPFDALLQAHVRDGMVDYQGFRDDVAELDRYLATLAQANLDGATREEQLAFYINAYNACTIRLILRHYGKIESIREIRKPWDTREWPLAGEVLTINEIEHQKLRDQLREPRIHFAIVCASIGCPKLASRAYTATHVDAELEAAARGRLHRRQPADGGRVRGPVCRRDHRRLHPRGGARAEDPLPGL